MLRIKCINGYILLNFIHKYVIEKEKKSLKLLHNIFAEWQKYQFSLFVNF